MSGGWLVWACWIPAWAATAWLSRLFSWSPKCVLALVAHVSFLCCIPSMRALSWLKKSRFHPVLCLSGLRCGVDLKAPSVFHFPHVSTRVWVVGPRWRARSLGCGKFSGHEALGPYLSRNKAFYASCERRSLPFWLSPRGLAHAVSTSMRNATWLILPVVICLSQRLSHACVSMN